MSAGEISVEELLLTTNTFAVSIPDQSTVESQTGENELTTPDDALMSVGAGNSVVELIIIDSAVEDLEVLLDEVQVKPGVVLEFLILEQDENGIEQITRFLSEPGDVNAVHIVSHGKDGLVELGNSTLNADNVNDYRSLLDSWKSSLANDADILFYGCDLAFTEEGRLLIDTLAEILDSDVAASIDTTGHASAGGNWSLEYESGSIQTELFLSEEGIQNWKATLDVTSDLVGHWTFDNINPTVVDDSGNGMTGSGFQYRTTSVTVPRGWDGQLILLQMLLATTDMLRYPTVPLWILVLVILQSLSGTRRIAMPITTTI